MYSIQYLLKKILFPRTCIVCKKGNQSLCPTCLERIQIVPKVVSLSTCTEITFLQYQHPSVAKIIWELKYKNNTELRHQVIARLAPITQKEINYILHNQTHITYIAVPKTKYDHTKNRDFDHAYLLAKKWQALLAYPGNVLDGCLIKTNHTRQVEHRSRHDRIAQARNSIQATDILLSRKPTSDTLCIIDDVTTTGATRDEMIRVLRPFFTGRIIFLALAH